MNIFGKIGTLLYHAKLYGDMKGETNMVDKIIGIAIALLIVAIVFPIALDELAGMDTSLWEPAVATLMTVLLPVLAVIGIILHITRRD